METSTVSFKKKAPRGSIRVRSTEEVTQSSGSADGDTTAEEALLLSDIKLQQTMRLRKGGSALDALLGSKARQYENAHPLPSAEVTTTIESVMGTQYTRQLDYGLQHTVPHKNLMDEYVNGKLGINPQM